MHTILKAACWIAAALVMPVSTASAGLVIAIDFGATTTTDTSFNTGVTDDVVNLTNTLGVATGVGLEITSNGGNPVNNNAVFVDGSASGGSGDFNVYDDGIIIAGTGNDVLTITFTGLDDGLTYNLFAGGQTLGADFGATWNIAGQAEQSFFQNQDPFAFFSNIATNGSGSISLVLNDIDNGGAPTTGRNVGLSELRLTAVPEPTSLTLFAFSCLGLLYRRRVDRQRR